MTRMPRRGQTLLLDADDTLWENNVYFERAIARFYHLVDPEGDAGTMRECINGEERRVIAEMGYGLESFRVALTRAFQALAPGRWNAEAAEAVGALAAGIAAEPIEFVAGAVETLHYLAPRHRLVLMTKGDYAEQSRKVELSGLGPLFEQVHVVAEKDEAAYRAKLEQLAAPAERCWMIGNSPKSDINPALAAGLNAVLIPHPHTWVLEHDAVVAREGREFLQLERIGELRLHF
ncbi:MAG TPA: HAD family hydrolase [Terriglobales bacterium]|nr:HAD family hydrolase [Terriglobales bacterium]